MKIIKYFIVGSIAALTDFSLFYIFAKLLDYNYFAVALFSFSIATFVNYILSIKYVFKSGKNFSKRKELGLIYLVSGIGIIANLIILWILIEFLSIEILVSKIIATLIIFLWNYFIRNNFVFKENKNI